MQNKLVMPGVREMILPQERFTTTRLAVAFAIPMGEDQAALACLPYLLRRRSAAYPDMTELNQRLLSLYAAVIEISVVGAGDTVVLSAEADLLRDRLAPNGDTPTEDGAAVLRELLFRPFLTDGAFDAEDLAIAKRCLIEQIRSDINEKRRYARQACVKRMYEGTPYAMPLLGTEEQAAVLTAGDVTAAWRRMLEEATVQVVLQGADDADAVLEPLYAELKAIRRRPAPLPETVISDRADRRRDEERMELNQCKLVMGVYTPIAGDSKQVDAMRLASGLLGGTVCSMLFRHVREEQSLCYYCSSNYNRHKGYLLIDSGVEAAKTDDAEREILRWVDALQKGEFTEEDLAAVKRCMETDYRTAEDDQAALVSWLLGGVLGYEEVRLPSEVADSLETITKQEVMDAAATWRIGVVYRLMPKEDAV